MPNIESLARSGLILEQNYVQPTCSPSRTALLTGSQLALLTGSQVVLLIGSQVALLTG